MEKKFLLVVIALVLMFSVTSFAPKTYADTDGGTFKWGITPPDNTNPFVSVNESSIILQRLNYESLVDYDTDFNYVPYLAEKWEQSTDGLTWTFHITDKSKWQDDGSALTAEDVKFTIEYIRDNKLGQFYSYVSPITKVETPDNTTIVMHLDKPLSTMLYNMRNLIILPKHIWSKLSGKEALDYKNDPVIGSGPFKFIEWKKGQYVEMQAIKDYWNGSPKIDTLILKEVTNNETAISALKSGELDGIRDVPANLVAALKTEKNITVEPMKSFWFYELIINGSIDGTKVNPLLRDKAIRTAIAHAIDKQKLVDLVHYGSAEPGVSIISSANTKWFNTNTEQYNFDMEKAKQILEDAGYKDTDGDGIREKGGNPLSFRFNVMNETPAFRAAQQISEWLKQIGIAATPIQTEDLGALIYRDDDKNNVTDADFDLMLWDWSGDPDPSFNLMTMLTEQIGSWQDAQYSNKQYDELYDEQQHAMDETQRKQIVDQMQQILYSDVPYVVLYYPQRIQAYRSDKWAGLIPMVDGFISKLNIQTAMQVHMVEPEQASAVSSDDQSASNNATVTTIPAPSTASSSSNYTLWIIIGIGIVLLVIFFIRRRNREAD